MKKLLCLVIALISCLAVFAACNQKAPEVYCRVECVNEDGFIVWTEDWGNIYIKYENPNLTIKRFDTVIAEFSSEDLKPATGSFVSLGGNEESYSYILEEPQGIRLADPSAGEPTFG